jgi:heptosyltransferase-1
MTTPAVTALKRALPEASLVYVIEEPYRKLVEGNPDLAGVLTLPAHQSAFGFLIFIRRLRRERYDLVLDFHGGPRASLLALLSGAGLKVGYELKYKRRFYDVRIPRARPDGGYFHSVENHVNLVRAAGILVENPLPPLTLPPATPKECARIGDYWADHGLAGTKVVALHVGAGNEFRDWGPSNLGALADLLAETPGVRVVLAGSAADERRAAEIQAKCRAPVISLAGRLNLIELRELIARASLFVGPDSGPMHIAASTKTPIVALFGPNLPEYNAPWQAEATIIQKDLDCRPCKQRECITLDFRCLRHITPEEVYSSCLKYLSEA